MKQVNEVSRVEKEITTQRCLDLTTRCLSKRPEVAHHSQERKNTLSRKTSQWNTLK
jgi:hypothetical protein